MANHNRFSTKKNRFPFPKIRFLYVIFPVILIVFLLAIGSLRETTITKQQESLESALMRDIAHCYAVEGFYPPSLDYIEEHYGLTYNKKLFFVDYQPIGSNMRPNVTILLRKASS
ncbi:MAG: hypothetical protein IKY23_02805 [Lachnospiraceae bacterium]|nr:hypothetical protein [Lachnospiraceae bacterium]